jgi:hypothetical protein
MVTSRFVHPHVHTSYGQAAGVGIAGGLIAGLIIGAIEKGKEGEILPGPALDSPAEEKIKMLVTNKVVLGELPQAGNPNVAITTPAQPAPTAPATQVAATPPGASIEAETAAIPASPAPPSAPTGVVNADGNSAYVASCGQYGVYIGCDSGQCRPLHTIKLEGDQ